MLGEVFTSAVDLNSSSLIVASTKVDRLPKTLVVQAAFAIHCSIAAIILAWCCGFSCASIWVRLRQKPTAPASCQTTTEGALDPKPLSRRVEGAVFLEGVVAKKRPNPRYKDFKPLSEGPARRHVLGTPSRSTRSRSSGAGSHTDGA